MVPLEIIRHGEVVEVISDDELGRVVPLGWGRYIRIGGGRGRGGEGYLVSTVAKGRRNTGAATRYVGKRSRDVAVALGSGFQAREVASEETRENEKRQRHG